VSEARNLPAHPLVGAVLSRRDDYTLFKHAAFKGDSNPEPRQPARLCLTFSSGAREPILRTSTPAIPSAPCKASSTRCAPSIRAAADEQRQLQRLDKTLTDYQAQAQRPFEHEARLKELLARQAQLNAALDIDKSDAQAAEAAVDLRLRRRRHRAAASQLRQECSQTPCPPRSPDHTTEIRQAGQARRNHDRRKLARQSARHGAGRRDVPQTLLRQQVKDFPRLISAVNAATAKSRPRRPAPARDEAIGALQSDSTLTVLNLMGYSIGDEGARALAYGLKGNATLATAVPWEQQHRGRRRAGAGRIPQVRASAGRQCDAGAEGEVSAESIGKTNGLGRPITLIPDGSRVAYRP